MKIVIALIGSLLAAILVTPREIAAQNLAIVNARILDGKAA